MKQPLQNPMNFKALAVLLVVSSISTTAQPPAEYALTIKPQQSASVQVGSEVTIEITQRNVSSEPIQIQEAKYPSEAAQWFQIYLRDENGNIAPETKYGHKARTGKDAPGESTVLVGGASIRDLPPGASVTHKIVLNTLYTLTQPGRYKIQVEGLDAKGQTAKSNVTLLTLTP